MLASCLCLVCNFGENAGEESKVQIIVDMAKSRDLIDASKE